MWKVVHNPLEIFENTWVTLCWWIEAQFSFPEDLFLFLEFLQRKIIAYMVKSAFSTYDCVVTIFHAFNYLQILKSKTLYITSHYHFNYNLRVFPQSVTSSDKRETHLWRELGHVPRTWPCPWLLPSGWFGREAQREYVYSQMSASS